MQPITLTPTHCYISGEGVVLVEGTLEDCEDARAWYQYPNFSVKEITTVLIDYIRSQAIIEAKAITMQIDYNRVSYIQAQIYYGQFSPQWFEWFNRTSPSVTARIKAHEAYCDRLLAEYYADCI